MLKRLCSAAIITWRYYVTIAFSVMLFNAQANSELSTITIAAGEMPYLMSGNSEFKGSYNDLIDKITAHLPFTIKISYFPPARAGEAFEQKAFDCLMPGQIKDMVEQQQRIASQPFNIAKAYIFNSVKEPPISSIAELFGKTLAKRRGFVYGMLQLDKQISTVDVNHISQSLQMLKAKRIDAFIAYEPDVLSILELHPEIGVHRSELVLHQQPEQIICHRSKSVKAFIISFNKVISQLSSSGELSFILQQNRYYAH